MSDDDDDFWAEYLADRHQLSSQLAAAEKDRRRARTEQGRSPAQQTAKSENKARSAKRPGSGNRAQQEREAVEDSRKETE